MDIGGRENGLQGKPPVGFFFVVHTLEMTGVGSSLFLQDLPGCDMHEMNDMIFIIIICVAFIQLL